MSTKRFLILFMLAMTTAVTATCGDDDDDDTGDTSTTGDTSGADDDDANADVFGGAPVVDRVLPLVAVSGGQIYIEGKHLATPSGKIEGVTVAVVGDSPQKSTEGARIELNISRGQPDRLTCDVPADMHERISGPANIEVTTPEGTVTAPSPVFAVEDNGFGGATEPGKGLFGTVYALLPQTPVLPSLDNTCDDPQVQNSANNAQQTFSCPHTYMLVPNLDVAVRSFTDGFPGLGTNLVEWFAIDFTSHLDVPADGTYNFSVCSDDGSKLFIGDLKTTPIIDNDGTHGMSCRQGTAELKKGMNPIRVFYFQGPATQIGLQLYWTKPGDAAESIIPAANFDLFGEE